jgi:hypothetical protein
MKRHWSICAQRAYDRLVESTVDVSPSVNGLGCLVLHYVGYSADTSV